jgi:hypothetical protein
MDEGVEAVLAILGAVVGPAVAEDNAAGRAKLAEMVAFVRLASVPCASALDASARMWPMEVLSLLTTVNPPITEAEIAAKKKETQEYRFRLGDA